MFNLRVYPLLTQRLANNWILSEEGQTVIKKSRYVRIRDWFVTISEKDGEKELTYSIEVSGEELSYIYRMEDMDREKSLFFDEIETFATLKKASKDGMVQGRTELAYSQGYWYWRSGIVDESREKDGELPGYVQKLPDLLCRTWKTCY